MIDEILIPLPKLSKEEAERLAKVESAPYSLRQMESVYFIGNEIDTHYQAIYHDLDLLVGETAKETYLNVQLFIYSKCKTTQ